VLKNHPSAEPMEDPLPPLNWQQRVVDAQELEKRHIARLLHDHVGQHAVVLALGIHALQEQCRCSDRARSLLEQLVGVSDQSSTEISRLMADLCAGPGEELDLSMALSRHGAEWSRRHGIPLAIHSEGLEGQRLPRYLETVLYRVLQGALANVAQHAHAQHTSILLHCRPDGVTAIVEDDGIGFTPGTPPFLGLNRMRAHLDLVGGSLVIETTPGAGTTLYARVPLPAGFAEVSG
jgi:signal transduction histidine kinase